MGDSRSWSPNYSVMAQSPYKKLKQAQPNPIHWEGGAGKAPLPSTLKSLLSSHHTQQYSVSCLISYEVLLLSVLNITLKHCNTLHPASVLPLPGEQEEEELSSRGDLQETRIENARLIWFTDGSYLRENQGHHRAGYAITDTINATNSKESNQARRLN
ncbi:hypothetical protein AAY473_003332 [Plecturocebus cupreus]